MNKSNTLSALVLGIFIACGLTSLGCFISKAVVKYKQYERTVTVKGLAEIEQKADVVIWPIQFSNTNNSLEALYNLIDENSNKIKEFLTKNGISAEEISFATPSITDKSAQQYSDNTKVEFRYASLQTVTVYSKNIDNVRTVMGKLSELGKQGIAFTGDTYQSKTEYLFTKLNEIKPKMIEEATKNAREVAQKFASDSNSKLGKIRSATQGQFSINDRDTNNPQIKQIRVVSTVEYYLSD